MTFKPEAQEPRWCAASKDRTLGLYEVFRTGSRTGGSEVPGLVENPGKTMGQSLADPQG